MRKVSSFFQEVNRPAAPRLRALCGGVNRGLAGGVVKGNHLLRRLSSQAPRMTIPNLPGHLDRSNSLGAFMRRHFPGRQNTEGLLHPTLDETGG